MKRLLLSLFLALAANARAADAPLDPAQTKIEFTGHATLHDFEGTARDIKGDAQVDNVNPNFVTNAKVEVATANMTTFSDGRDKHMREWLHIDVNPGIEFHLAKITRTAPGVISGPSKNHPQFDVTGDFTLNGKTKPLTAQAKGWIDGHTLIVEGTTKIDTTEYGLPIIKQFFLTVDQNVDVRFHLVFDLPAGASPAHKGTLNTE
jgi:polyisoprenoid-binding protein YceI